MATARKPAPKIVVLQRGGYKDHHPLLVAACHHFLLQQMSARLVNTLAIRIEARASKLDPNCDGVCYHDTTGSQSQREFTLVIQRDRTLADQLLTLAHETVHVAQRATNKLQFRKWKSDTIMHARWDGKDTGPSISIPYRDRPWEVEAYDKQDELVAAYFSSRAA